MHSHDSLYITERARTELALRMIGHEARTHTIRRCTGLSDDRIRKVYATYFKGRDGVSVRRRRGKSPRQIGRYVKNARHQLETTTLTHLFIASGLLALGACGKLRPRLGEPGIDYGHRLCAAYETYRLLHPGALLGFEWAWSLLQILARGQELALSACRACGVLYIHDALALNHRRCPACEIRTERRRRPGPATYNRG